jgi:hypothetical protein
MFLCAYVCIGMFAYIHMYRRAYVYYMYNYMYTICIFYVYYMYNYMYNYVYIICILSVYYTYIICILYVYYMYIICEKMVEDPTRSVSASTFWRAVAAPTWNQLTKRLELGGVLEKWMKGET